MSPLRSAQPPALRVVEGGAQPRKKSDDELLSLFERGDMHASSELFDRLIDVVDATVFRVIGKREADHEDLVQSSFEQIIISLTRGKFARACSLSSWAVSIATHVALNSLRSRIRERRWVDRTHVTEAVKESVRGVGDVERDAAAREQLRLVREVLASMDEAKAETVLLHDGMGYELAEIAFLMGVTVAAAQSRLVRGRKELHTKLAAVGAVLAEVDHGK